MNVEIESNYIHEDHILSKIYERAVRKFFDISENKIIFYDAARYIHDQLCWKKQSPYMHSLAILKELCQRVGESFDDGCDMIAPDANCYRDIYFELY